MHQQLWGYKVEEKLYLGVGEQNWENVTDLEDTRQPAGAPDMTILSLLPTCLLVTCIEGPCVCVCVCLSVYPPY
jgi:hypothetical protein